MVNRPNSATPATPSRARYTKLIGCNVIERDGEPFIAITGESETPKWIVNAAIRIICELLNEHDIKFTDRD